MRLVVVGGEHLRELETDESDEERSFAGREAALRRFVGGHCRVPFAGRGLDPSARDVGLGGQHRAVGLGGNRGEAVSGRAGGSDVAVGELGLDEQRQQRRRRAVHRRRAVPNLAAAPQPRLPAHCG